MKHKSLLEKLSTIRGSGSFVHQGSKKVKIFGLSIDDFGDLPLPIIPLTAKGLLSIAMPSPFGRGEKTVFDNQVRRSHEIDADKISFSGAVWDKMLKKILQEVKEGLGLGNIDLEAHLYKMLIYQPGDFFLPHRDSEKEKGMFGTLVIGLPGKHTGGELCISAYGQEVVADFSQHDQENLSYVAFFADCEHEVKPLLSGYRVCLTYNLVRKSGVIQFDNPKQHVAELASWLRTYHSKNKEEIWPKVVMFEHQYTPTNFSLESLKGADKPRAISLIEACAEAGFYASPCLLTYYDAGSWEPDYNSKRNKYRRGGYWEDYDLDEDNPSGIMGEVYDSSIEIEHWDYSLNPGLGNLYLDEEQVWTNTKYDSADPIKKQAEGPTGNAGMELYYWYHYAAVCLWPKSELSDQLPNDANLCMEWLGYFIKKVQQGDQDAVKEMREMLLNYDYLSAKDLKNADPLLQALLLLKDKEIVEKLHPVLVSQFYAIQSEIFVSFTQAFGVKPAISVLEEALAQQQATSVISALSALQLLTTSPKLKEAALDLIEKLPDLLLKELFLVKKEPDWQASDAKKENKQLILINHLIALSQISGVSIQYTHKMTVFFELIIERKLVFKAMAPALQNGHNKKAPLQQALLKVVIEWLTKKTEVKPEPPSDWKRPYPKDWNQKSHICHQFVSFMESPTEKEYRFVRVQYERSQVEYMLTKDIDLTPSTIRKGSPHTLLLTKNQDTYVRERKMYDEELSLLGKLRILLRI